MSQKSRPVSDVLTGAWTPTPVFSQVNEETPDDASKVSSGNDPQGDAFEVRLASLAWPSTGAQTLTVRLRKDGPDTLYVTIRLLQGSAGIASTLVQSGSGFAAATIALTDEQKLLITDYRELRARVIAGFESTNACSQCPSAPKVWGCSVSGISGPFCRIFNMTHLMSHVSGCTWGWSEARVAAELSFGGGLWTLTFSLNQGVVATYTKAAASWDCLGTNVMNLASTSGPCSGWPPTVQVCPAAL